MVEYEPKIWLKSNKSILIMKRIIIITQKNRPENVSEEYVETVVLSDKITKYLEKKKVVRL